MGKKIGVLMGGLSEEREISLKTGAAILKALGVRGYRAAAIDAGRDLAAVLVKSKVEVAFLALHGRYGEDGCVQGLLEVMGIPYTGSGVQASSVAMDKVSAKKMLIFNGISTPDFSVLAEGKKTPSLKLPLVVKPASQGSAIGVSIVKRRSDFAGAVKEASRHGKAVMVEKYIEGRELTVSILDGKVLPIIEICPREGFYDYTNKYTKGKTDFLVPARLKRTTLKRVEKEALGAYHALGCSGAARVDVMLGGKEAPFVLEVNTIPGMTELSLFPRAAAEAGLDYPALVEKMLMGAGVDKF
ncbi:MAG: D-alanine--D-alanine ligase [Deltaproteobacteria bacterium]|nr:D-alanine--D-alanine ligase [Deltaproteobacteria bacterium]